METNNAYCFDCLFICDNLTPRLRKTELVNGICAARAFFVCFALVFFYPFSLHLGLVALHLFDFCPLLFLLVSRIGCGL